MITLEEQFNGFYSEILNFPIKERIKNLKTSFHKTFFARVAKALDADSMCAYLFDYASNTVAQLNLFGDSQCWKTINPNLLNRDVELINDFSFFKIRHTTLDDKYILIGYIGVYKKNIQPNEIKCMDLFGMIYGNYISKRITKNQIVQTNSILPQIYTSIAQAQLPGSIIFRVLQDFRKLMRYYRGLFITIDGTSWFPEYFVTNNKRFILESSPIKVGQGLFDFISHNQHREKELNVYQMPLRLQNLICRNETRRRSDFIGYFYPVMDENTIIGLWLIVFHCNQINDYINANDLIHNIHPFIGRYYNYLYQRRTKKMIVNPIFRERDTKVKENNVFTIMPFTEVWSDTLWKHLIKPTVESLGLNALRADDLYGQNIMEDVWKGILQSSIIIADITGRNANVFYELGIAHTLGKNVILLTQNVKDIPFDLNVYRHIVYNTSIPGGDDLKERLGNAIKEYLPL